MGLLNRLFSRKPAPVAPAAVMSADAVTATAVPQAMALAPGLNLQYPPADPGLPLVKANVMLNDQAQLLSATRMHAAARPELFDKRYVEPLARVAAYVSSLPATSSDLFSGPGGLFRASCELAFAAFRASDSKIFTPHAGVEERHALEGRWRYVCFLGGLIWPLGRTLEQVKVTSQTGALWSARSESIASWGERSGVAHYFVTWPKAAVVPGPAATGAAVALALAGPENLAWLEEGSPQLVTALLGICSGTTDQRYNTAFDVVSMMWKRVCDAEQARRPVTYGRLQFGHHLAPHFVDAMARLVGEGKWQVGKAPMFADTSGLYLAWPQAAIDILEQLRDAGTAGLPQTANGLLSVLEDCGLVAVKGESGALVDIADNDGSIGAGVRLVNPQGIVDGFTVEAYAGQRRVLLDNIVKADPLAQAAKRASGPSKVAPKQDDAPSAPPAPGPDILASTLTASAPVAAPVASPAPAHEANADRETEQQEEAAPTPERAAAVAEAAQSSRPRAENPKTEGDRPKAKKPLPAEAVAYIDVVPEVWRQQLTKRDAEVLGRLISVHRDGKTPDAFVSTKDGLAVAYSVLADLVSSPVDFLQTASQKGMLYVNPTTPGKLMHQLETEKGKDRYFILKEYAVRQMGINK